MDRLKDLLNEPKPDMASVEATKLFREIAETLMGNYIIKKGEKRYAIIEIEFYLYTPQHQDFITYPRKMEAGRWFFHQSGVDLTFKTEGEPKSGTVKDKNGNETSKWNYSSCSFGGILIRGLYRFSFKDDKQKEQDAKYIFGPQNCVIELWDNFDAFNYTSHEYPVLGLASKSEGRFHTTSLISYKRRIKIGKDKTIEIKEKEWAERIGIPLSDQRWEEKSKEKIKMGKEDSAIIDILEAKYRFFNIIDGENTWKEIKHLTNTEKKDLKKLIQG